MSFKPLLVVVTENCPDRREPGLGHYIDLLTSGYMALRRSCLVPTANQEAVRKGKAWHSFENAGIPRALRSLTHSPAHSAIRSGSCSPTEPAGFPSDSPPASSLFLLSPLLLYLFYLLPALLHPSTCSKVPLAHSPPKAN